MRHASCFGAAVLVVVSVRLAALTPPGEEMRLPRSVAGLPVVSLQVGGETLRFGIDTGTSLSLVSAQVARRLRLTPRWRFSVNSTAGAPADGLCGIVPEIRLGRLPIALDCLGWLPSEPRLAGAEDLDGLLGADALAHLDLWIDVGPPRVRARFAPPGSLAPWTEGTRLRLEMVGRRLSIAASLPALGRDSPAARLIVDSGSDGLVLFGGLARRAATVLSHRQTAGRLEAATGARQLAVVALSGVQVGGSHLDIGWAGLLPDVDRPEDGLLPLGALGPVLLDVTNGVMIAGARFRPAPRFNVEALSFGSPEVQVTSPASLSGPYQFGTAGFGPLRRCLAIPAPAKTAGRGQVVKNAMIQDLTPECW